MKLRHRHNVDESPDPAGGDNETVPRAFPGRSIYDEEDQRPSREDLAASRTRFFDIPVPLPRILRSKKTRKDPHDRVS